MAQTCDECPFKDLCPRMAPHKRSCVVGRNPFLSVHTAVIALAALASLL